VPARSVIDQTGSCSTPQQLTLPLVHGKERRSAVQVTEVRIKLMDGEQRHGNERLLAFCSITLDDAFVIRDLKIIEGTSGWFVAMPSRHLTDRCPSCDAKNSLRSRYCSNCGRKLGEDRAPRDPDGRVKLHADIAHPINQQCRDMIQQAVLREYEAELRRARQARGESAQSAVGAGDDSYASVISRLDGPNAGRRMHCGSSRTEHAAHGQPAETPTADEQS